MFKPLRQRLDKLRGNYESIAIDNILLDLYPFKLTWLKNNKMTCNNYLFIFTVKRRTKLNKQEQKPCG